MEVRGLENDFARLGYFQLGRYIARVDAGGPENRARRHSVSVVFRELAKYLITFSSSAPGREVRQTASEPKAVNLVQHHSLIRLPDAGFRPRKYDARMGAYSVAYHDYATALDEPIVRRRAVRPGIACIVPAASSRTRGTAVHAGQVQDHA